ncbi:TNF receptor-associated factor 3-like isoform X2 [Oculina patagonica]
MCTTKVKFLQRLDERLTCPICKNVFNEPWQTSCGHRFCLNCLESLLRSSCPKCPVDGENIARNTSFRDKCCERDVLDLQCSCRYEAINCGWQGELRHLQVHEDSCQYGDVLCKACGENLERRLLEDHRTNDCINRAVKCAYCGGEVQLSNMKDHLEMCLKFPINCILSCGKEAIPRDTMAEHVTTHCPMAEGKKETLDEHLNDSLNYHLHMINQSCYEYDAINKETEQKVSCLETEINALGIQINKQNEELVTARINIQTQQVKLYVMENSICEQRRDVDKLTRDLESIGNITNRDVLSSQMQEIFNTITEHETKMNTLQSELARLRVVVQTQHVHEFQGSQSASARACEKRLDRAEHQLALHEIQLSEQDMQIQMLEATSYNGVYVWKIDHFSRRFEEAVSGKTPSIYSPPFFVGRFGYKVCARLYPNGDGIGKGTHLSIFFVIMKGEYDALLPWPFIQKVHFRLLDQNGIRDVIDAFRPDPDCASFKRPTSDMNVASGCPTFISQAEVREGGYIRDDVMFIKVTVDMVNLQGELWR